MGLGGKGSAGLEQLGSWAGSLHMLIGLREVVEVDQESRVVESG